MLGGGYTRTDYAPAAKLRGEFYMDTIKDTLASLEAGRDIFREIERVKIIIPGASASIVVKNVTDEHRQRWPEQYQAWKAGRDPVLAGTPLELWPILNPSAIAELKYLQIRTVEELAGLSDIACQHIGMGGTVLRERAIAWLDDAKHEAFTTRLLHDNDVLRSEVAAMKVQIETLTQQYISLSQSSHRWRDEVPAFQTYVPGQHDPAELAKQQQMQLPSPRPNLSALDQLASVYGQAQGRHHPPPEMASLEAGAAEAA